MSVLEALTYRDRGTALTGWLAYPDGPARAAVVVFPTIANVTPAIERRALMLAEAGYAHVSFPDGRGGWEELAL